MPDSFVIKLPENVMRLVDLCVRRSDLYPDPDSLIAESVMRLHVTVNSRGPGSVKKDAERFGGMFSETEIQMDIRISENTFRNVSKLSCSMGVNLFAVAVMVQLDRLHQLPE